MSHRSEWQTIVGSFESDTAIDGSAATPKRCFGKSKRQSGPRTVGQLKIFLGYASGVGKSFRLFDEGRRRHERGEDVVVAATQPDSPPDVAD